MPTMGELLEGAALDPPPGVESHFVTYDPNAMKWYYFAAVMCIVVPGLLLILRLYTKLRIIRKTDLTDYASSIAFFMFIALVVLGKKFFDHGAGVHQWNLRRKDYDLVLYYMNINQILYGPTMTLVKVAILLQYIYLLAPNVSVNPFLSIGSRLLIAISVMFYIANTCVTIWTCYPREKIWNDLVEGKCMDNNTLILITCAFNVLSDVAILLLPARTVWGLRIETKKKMGICTLFATGLLACITNAFVVMYLLKMPNADSDISYYIGWVGMWSAAEIALGLCVICMLVMPKFMEAKGNRLLSRLTSLRSLSTLSRGSGSGNGSGNGSGDASGNASGRWRSERGKDSQANSIIGQGEPSSSRLPSREPSQEASRETRREREIRMDAGAETLKVPGVVKMNAKLSDIELQPL
ncbi:hypothetical protein P280DRAFT_476322 [Massarina eburnea CBS 473.64]|uniref:Rhodopsin domain-containing protein n=1 Tax=Massarina eburnea CBS 473.64 TaxID=1395130 RepID=A0A6A6SHF0_9PLEO|nr:hypothetical protein P280DRAFT_476322 [Massarina eburnea CBS 473.64]